MNTKEAEGREVSSKIDAMVAEKVMGWVEMDRHTAYRDTHNYELTGWWHRPNGETTQRSERFGDEMPWSPSTDIFAAWAVVEKMRADGFEYRLWDHKGNHGCIFDNGKGSRSLADFEVPHMGDAPIAICIAALKAVSVPESAIQEALQ